METQSQTYKECDAEGTKKMRQMFKDSHILFHLLTLTGDNKWTPTKKSIGKNFALEFGIFIGVFSVNIKR